MFFRDAGPLTRILSRFLQLKKSLVFVVLRDWRLLKDFLSSCFYYSVISGRRWGILSNLAPDNWRISQDSCRAGAILWRIFTVPSRLFFKPLAFCLKKDSFGFFLLGIGRDASRSCFQRLRRRVSRHRRRRRQVFEVKPIKTRYSARVNNEIQRRPRPSNGKSNTRTLLRTQATTFRLDY